MSGYFKSKVQVEYTVNTTFAAASDGDGTWTAVGKVAAKIYPASAANPNGAITMSLPLVDPSRRYIITPIATGAQTVKLYSFITKKEAGIAQFQFEDGIAGTDTLVFDGVDNREATGKVTHGGGPSQETVTVTSITPLVATFAKPHPKAHPGSTPNGQRASDGHGIVNVPRSAFLHWRFRYTDAAGVKQVVYAANTPDASGAQKLLQLLAAS